MNAIWFLLARIGLALVFILAGFNKFMNIGGITGVLGSKGFPQPTAFAYAVATLEVVGGLLIVLGFKTRAVAIIMLLFTAGTVIVSHNFWDMEGAARAMNQTQALKNLAIMGGFLLLALSGPGRYSVDRG